MGAKESTESRQQEPESVGEEEKKKKVGEEVNEVKADKKEASSVQNEKVDEGYEGREPVVEELIEPVIKIKPTHVLNVPTVSIFYNK